MLVMIVEPDKEPYTEKIWNDLDTLKQKLGNKNLEIIEFNNVLLVYNSRGLIDNIPINRYLDGLAIRGTFIITGNNTKEMDFMSLTEEEINEYMEKLTLDREEELEL